MKINFIKALKDNYIWTIEEDEKVVLVDPGEAEPCFSYLKDKKLSAILLTHKHLDHTGGVGELKEKFEDVLVIGPKETSDLNDKTVDEGDSFTLLGHDFEILKTDGHTDYHISFLVEGKLFCGDTIFSSGCGKVFTKKYDRSFNSVKKIKDLPKETLIYPAHEYTLDCLKSSKRIIKDKVMDDAIEDAKVKLSKGLPSLPTSVEKEYLVNPFFTAKDLDQFKEYIKIKE